jgi:UPF0755 protein
MAKYFLILFVLLLLFVGAFGIYSAIQYRDTMRYQRQHAQAPHLTITIKEGWNDQQIADYLQDQQIISSSANFLAAIKTFDASGYPLLSGRPTSAGLEGYLFPDTYFLPSSSTTDQDISDLVITKALDNFSQKITPQMQQQASSSGMSLYQIITLASIIEKESGSDQTERQTIAGIFYNRLKAGMPLESDATISYITGNPTFSAADKQINSPYNTYLNAGLPYGPICNPSLGSIMAALNPISSNYFYFLTIPNSGQAVYAQTYQEHLANQQKYLY